MKQRLRALFLERAKNYLDSISDSDRGAIYRDIEALCANELTGVQIKTLKTPVRELISGYHRMTYFKLLDTLYFPSGFRKKSAKTPKREIEYAHHIFTLLKLQSE